MRPALKLLVTPHLMRGPAFCGGGSTKAGPRVKHGVTDSEKRAYKSSRQPPDPAPIGGAPERASVAQLVEQRIENPRVGGSNPPRGTTFRRS